MTREQARTYFKELAQRGGVEEKEISSILQVLDDDKMGKLFLDGFVPRPEYSSALDAKVKEAEAARAEEKRIRDWHEKEGKPAYEANLKGVERLRKYEARFGDLDEESTTEEKRRAAEGSGLSMKQVEEYFDKKMREQGQAYVNLTKTAVKISQDYGRRFNKNLDVDALEKFAIDKGLPLDMAYQEFIRPEAEAQTTEQWEAKIKAAREEGAKDYASKHKLPATSGPREPHPIFDHTEPKEGANDGAGRDAFLEGWNEVADGIVAQNK